MNSDSKNIFFNLMSLIINCIGSPKFLMLIIGSSLFSASISTAQPGKRIQRMFDQARRYYTLKDYEKAAERGLEILARDSLFLDAHLLLADVYNDTKNPTSEIFHLTRATKINGRPLIYYRL